MGTAKPEKVKNNNSKLSRTQSYFHKLLCLVAFAVILYQPIVTVYNLRDTFFRPGYSANYEQYKNAYDSSQYVKKKNPGIIPDETFESFAGGAFLKGLNPVLIVHDHPPMGRYIVALSIFLFDNASTIILPLLAVSILGLYLIAKLIIPNTILAMIPIGVFINEPLFINKIIFTPLPEPIHLPFIVFSIYFFLKSVRTEKYTKWFVLTSIMLGFVISIRFFVLGSALGAAMLAFLILKQRDKRRIITFIATLPISLLVLLAAYTRTFTSGYSLREVIGIQKYILAYHNSKFILPFSYWDLLLFNRWHTWWGERLISYDPQWFISWPISVFTTMLASITALARKISLKKEEVVLLLWVGSYSLLLSTGYTSTRYFLPVLPFFYILATSFVVKIFKTKFVRK